jgi:hypothetical protein
MVNDQKKGIGYAHSTRSFFWTDLLIIEDGDCVRCSSLTFLFLLAFHVAAISRQMSSDVRPMQGARAVEIHILQPVRLPASKRRRTRRTLRNPL